MGSDVRIPWKPMGAMLLVGLAVRVLFAFAIGLTYPFGEDAEFWGYRAIELGNAVWIGSHPPVYPAIAWVVATVLPGVDLAWALWQVAIGMGALMAPAMCLGMTRIAGRGAGLAAGWMTLLLPNLIAWSLRVEPSSTFVVLLGLCLFLAGEVAHARSAAAAAALGFGIFLLGLTKENGFIYLVPVALPAAFASRTRLVPVVLALAVGFGGPFVPFQLRDTSAEGGGQSEKASLPLHDMQSLLDEGRLMPPLKSQDDPVIAPSDDTIRELEAPTTSSDRRLEIVAEIQLKRLARFLGVWLLLVPLAVVGAVAGWRRGEVALWQLAFGVGAAGMISMAVLVFVQPRHAEVAILGTIWLLSLSMPRWWAAGGARRAGIIVTGAALAVQTAYLLGTLEATRAEKIQLRAIECKLAAKWAQKTIPANGRLCSEFYWVGFMTEELTQFCTSPDFKEDTGGPVYLLIEDNEKQGEGVESVDDELKPVATIARVDTRTIGRLELVKVHASSEEVAASGGIMRPDDLWMVMGLTPPADPGKGPEGGKPPEGKGPEGGKPPEGMGPEGGKPPEGMGHEGGKPPEGLEGGKPPEGRGPEGGKPPEGPTGAGEGRPQEGEGRPFEGERAGYPRPSPRVSPWDSPGQSTPR